MEWDRAPTPPTPLVSIELWLFLSMDSLRFGGFWVGCGGLSRFGGSVIWWVSGGWVIHNSLPEWFTRYFGHGDNNRPTKQPVEASEKVILAYLVYSAYSASSLFFVRIKVVVVWNIVRFTRFIFFTNCSNSKPVMYCHLLDYKKMSDHLFLMSCALLSWSLSPTEYCFPFLSMNLVV